MLASLPEIREFAHSKAARGIGRDALDVLFTEARTANGFLPEQVAADILERVAQLCHLAPTAVNANPLRVVFVQTDEAKARLLPALSTDLNFVETLVSMPARWAVSIKPKSTRNSFPTDRSRATC